MAKILPFLRDFWDTLGKENISRQKIYNVSKGSMDKLKDNYVLTDIYNSTEVYRKQ